MCIINHLPADVFKINRMSALAHVPAHLLIKLYYLPDFPVDNLTFHRIFTLSQTPLAPEE